MVEYFRVGVITSAHGIKGAVKVFPRTDDPSRFEDLEEVFYSKHDSEKIEGSYRIQDVAYLQNMVLLKFEGINDRNTSELLKGQELWVDRAHAVDLEEGEYYMADLIGMKVVSEEGEDVGTVEDYMETPANIVLQIRKNHQEMLVPMVDEFVKDVDLENNVMTIHMMVGLRGSDQEKKA